MELDSIIYGLILNRIRRDVNKKFFRENIEQITLSDIPMEVKERGNYILFSEIYMYECNYYRERKRLKEEMFRILNSLN